MNDEQIPDPTPDPTNQEAQDFNPGLMLLTALQQMVLGQKELRQELAMLDSKVDLLLQQAGIDPNALRAVAADKIEYVLVPMRKEDLTPENFQSMIEIRLADDYSETKNFSIGIPHDYSDTHGFNFEPVSSIPNESLGQAIQKYVEENEELAVGVSHIYQVNYFIRNDEVDNKPIEPAQDQSIEIPA